MTLLPVAEAQARLLALAAPLEVETVPLDAAAGRWAAADVIARRTQPAADLSVMDGYAIRFADLPGPWRVIGETPAGAEAGRPIGAGEAVRIFTGARLPPAADAVLVQEEALREGDRLILAGKGPPAIGAYVRRRGSDFADGAILIEAGARLTPARIALAAIGGHGALAVRRRPRVALLSTGDELIPPGADGPDTALPASNAVMLRAMIAAEADVVDLGIVPDRLDALTDAFARAAECADVIVSTGGASVGDHDLVRPALTALGGRLYFWRIAMRPGKPLLAGRLGDAIMLGLPGNPVSAFVTALMFLRPLLAHLGGADDAFPRRATARLSSPLPAAGDRAFYVRARLDGGHATPLPSTDSAVLGSLAQADALIVRAAHAPPAAVDDFVDIVPVG